MIVSRGPKKWSYCPKTVHALKGVILSCFAHQIKSFLSIIDSSLSIDSRLTLLTLQNLECFYIFNAFACFISFNRVILTVLLRRVNMYSASMCFILFLHYNEQWINFYIIRIKPIPKVFAKWHWSLCYCTFTTWLQAFRHSTWTSEWPRK